MEFEADVTGGTSHPVAPFLFSGLSYFVGICEGERPCIHLKFFFLVTLWVSAQRSIFEDMTQQAQVPEFGNWETEDNVPYTVYFENARKGRSGSKTNPRDTDKLSNDKSSVKDSPSQQEAELEAEKELETVNARFKHHMSNEDGEQMAIQTVHQHHVGVVSANSRSESEASKGVDADSKRRKGQASREDGDLRKVTDSLSHHDAVSRKMTVDSPHNRLGTDSPKRIPKQSLGSDRSIEQSPLHPHQQARIGNKGSGVSSPSWERKGSSEGSHGITPFTPGRSRLRSVTGGDETPDHTPAVPKFGDWDETNPSAAEGYTQLFNKVREERQSGAGKVPVMPMETSHSNGQQNRNDNSKGCQCFSWCKK